MIEERHVSAEELIATLNTVLAGIRDGVVYRVGEGAGAFVLGPEKICGQVLGLFDPEYGWPDHVPLASIRSVDALRPGSRRHPFVVDGHTVVAVAIQVTEYDKIIGSEQA